MSGLGRGLDSLRTLLFSRGKANLQGIPAQLINAPLKDRNAFLEHAVEVLSRHTQQIDSLGRLVWINAESRCDLEIARGFNHLISIDRHGVSFLRAFLGYGLTP